MEVIIWSPLKEKRLQNLKTLFGEILPYADQKGFKISLENDFNRQGDPRIKIGSSVEDLFEILEPFYGKIDLTPMTSVMRF